MPVTSLTPEQEAQYGRFAGAPTPQQLAQFFWFDEVDRAHIDRHRGAHNRLGLSCNWVPHVFWARFSRTRRWFWPPVAEYVAQQLAVDAAAPDLLETYRGLESRWNHTREIREIYGYPDFADRPAHWRLVRWLYQRAWLMAERPSVLFDRTTAHLVESKILLPGVTTLTRLVARARDRT